MVEAPHGIRELHVGPLSGFRADEFHPRRVGRNAGHTASYLSDTYKAPRTDGGSRELATAFVQRLARRKCGKFRLLLASGRVASCESCHSFCIVRTASKQREESEP
jgi:hypothetical protein